MYFPGMEEFINDDGSGAEDINLKKEKEFQKSICYSHDFPNTGTMKSYCKHCEAVGWFCRRTGTYLANENYTNPHLSDGE